MILWDGSVIEASATENADLFWGLRGAGHNFGIVTEMTFQTWPQDNDGLHYNAAMTFTSDSLKGILETVNEIIPDQDPALAIDMFFHSNLDTLEVSYIMYIVLRHSMNRALILATAYHHSERSVCWSSRDWRAVHE